MLLACCYRHIYAKYPQDKIQKSLRKLQKQISEITTIDRSFLAVLARCTIEDLG